MKKIEHIIIILTLTLFSCAKVETETFPEVEKIKKDEAVFGTWELKYDSLVLRPDKITITYESFKEFFYGKPTVNNEWMNKFRDSIYLNFGCVTCNNNHYEYHLVNDSLFLSSAKYGDQKYHRVQ